MHGSGSIAIFATGWLATRNNLLRNPKIAQNTLLRMLLMKTLESDRYGPQKLMTKSRAEF